MHFIDEATIHVKAGDGGDGSSAMRREDNVPLGGPSGGDGGNGASVVFRADVQLGSLLDFRYKRHYKGERGEHGRAKDQYGAAAEDLVLRVPVGTVIYDADTGDLLADLATDGARAVVAQGGKGGRGNIHFKTPWNQAPRTCEPGTPGQERTLRLELKLLADVGLLGYPNVGKSTFISRVSRARPKIADYPFTTLIPNLGVVAEGPLSRPFVIADLPGLIAGAAQGAGLGIQFLRHVERCRTLLHLVDLSAEGSALLDLTTIEHELGEFSPDLLTRERILVGSKLDAMREERRDELAAAAAERKLPLLLISAATGQGLKPLVAMLAHRLEAQRLEAQRLDAPRLETPRVEAPR